MVLYILNIYRKVTKINYHVNSFTLSLIGIAFIALFNNWIAKMILYGCELYLTSQALSREFLSPYFVKVTYKMEKKDKKTYQYLLFGFGTAITLCFAIPIFGLIMYPVFQIAAADVLIVMYNRKKLTFDVEMSS